MLRSIIPAPRGASSGPTIFPKHGNAMDTPRGFGYSALAGPILALNGGYA